MHDALLAAGFLLVRPCPRQDGRSVDLLPDHLLSASTCVTAQFPGPYALPWASVAAAERIAEFDAIGVAKADRDAATAWASEAFEDTWGWPTGFYDLDDARIARSRWGAAAGWRLLGLGLRRRHADALLERCTPRQANVGTPGVLRTLARGLPLPTGGAVLGFEPLVSDRLPLEHSWLCNGLEGIAADRLGVRPNGWGLIDDESDALACCVAFGGPDVGAEPGLWLPWQIVEF